MIMVTAFSASIGVWRGHRASPLRSIVEVEMQSVYVLPLDSDTLYFEQHPTMAICQSHGKTSGDTLLADWNFSCEKDSAARTMRLKGFCIGRDAEVVVSTIDVGHILRGQRKTALFQQAFRQQQQALERMRRHDQELAYYARTHSAVDAGYNEVMQYAACHHRRLALAERTLRLLEKAIDSKQDAARRTSFKVNGRPVRMDYQRHSIVHLQPFSPQQLPPLASTAFLREVLQPWALAVTPLVIDSAGNRYRITATDSLIRGERFGTDGSYYCGCFNSKLQRSGEGFCMDDALVKYGWWSADRFRGETMLYTPHRIYGIDISRYQHEVRPSISRVKTKKGRVVRQQRVRRVGIDWDALRITHLGGKAQSHVLGEVDYPVSFVFIKCTQGTSIKSAYYAADMAAARKRNIPVAPYHFFSTRQSGAAQAAFFIQHARLSAATLPPMLDVEPSESEIQRMGGEQALFSEMIKWLQAVEQVSGRRPILYVSQSFVDRHMKNAPKPLLNYDVWIARYGEYRPYVKLLFWQLSPYGKVRGIHGDVDINVFNGSKQDFEEWLQAQKN